MDDRFLHQLRREPRPGFASSLRAHLRQGEDDLDRAPVRRLQPALVAAFAVAVVALSFTLPSVRATAQNMLDLFRVRTITPIAFDPARLDKLKALAPKDDEAATNLLFSNVEVLQKPAAPQTFPSLGAASAAAGIPAREISELPNGMRVEEVTVSGHGRTRFQVDTRKLQALLETLDLRDVQVPMELDGRTFTVDMPQAIRQHITGGGRQVEFVQAASPEMELPPGTDLSRLGEIGLRVLGMDAASARRTAASIDWKSTLVVPLPLDATSFREVTVHGQKGLLVNSRGEAAQSGGRPRSGSLLLWSEGGRMYALGGDARDLDLVQMAESVR